MSTRAENFLHGEVIKYLIPDIKRLRRLRPQGTEGLAGCTIPTAMLLFVITDLFGFLVRTDCRKPKIDDTKGNFRAIFSHPLAAFPDEYLTRLDTLVYLFRNGLMHQIFPKASGIRKSGMKAPLFESFDGLDHLNVDRFARDVLSMIVRFRDHISDRDSQGLCNQMSERLDLMSQRDFFETRSQTKGRTEGFRGHVMGNPDHTSSGEAQAMNDVPESIRDIFNKLRNEVTSLHARWKIYRQIFAHSDKRIALLNKCAPTFFFVIHGVFIDEIQLSLSRLTDSARTGKYEHLSLAQLQERVKSLGHDGLSSTLSDILVEIYGIRNSQDKPGKRKAIWTPRCKRLAHFDLDTSLNPDVDPLPGVSRQMIEDMLALVRKYMNTIEGYYCQSQYLYHDPIIGPHDGEALVAILKWGVRFHELSDEEKISWEDQHMGQWEDA